MNQVTIWQAITDTVRSLIGGLLSTTESWVTQGLPRILLAVVTLVVGWFVAVFVRKMTAKGLRGVGFDIVMERTGIQPFLYQRGVQMPPSVLIAWGLYAIVMYSALLMALQRAGFETGVALLSTVGAFIPRMIVALLLVAIGNWIGRWLGKIAARAARVADIPGAPVLGAVLHISILVFALLLAVRHLELASDSLLLLGLAFFLGALLVMAVLVAICARDWLLNLVAARVLSTKYQTGARIRIAEWEGEVVDVGSCSVTLKTPEGKTVIPAARLMNETVTCYTEPHD